MLDRLLQICFDGSNGDAKPLGDFAVGQALDPRKRQHRASSFGQLRNGTREKTDLGTLLDLMLGIGTVIRNVEQAIDFLYGQATAFGAPVVPGDVESDLEQIACRIANRSDLVKALDPQISFLQNVGGQIG